MPKLPDADVGLLLGAIQHHGVDIWAVNKKYQIPCPLCHMQRTKATATPCGLLVLEDGRVNMSCMHCGVIGFADANTDKKYNAPARSQSRPPPKPKTYKRPRPPVALEWDAKMQKGLAIRGIPEAVRQHFGVIKANCTLGKDDNDQWIKVPAICFPYYNGEDLIILKYRLLGKKKKEFRQSPEPEPSVYNINGLRDHISSDSPTKTAIICEGEFDVMALYTCGITNAITSNLGATKTNNTFTAELYFKCPELTQCENILMAGDGDMAGINLMETIANTIGIGRCKKVDWTLLCEPSCTHKTGEKNNKGELVLDAKGNPMTIQCKDAGDVLKNHGADGVRHCVDNALPMEEEAEGYIPTEPELNPNEIPAPPPMDSDRVEADPEESSTAPTSAPTPAPAKPKGKSAPAKPTTAPASAPAQSQTPESAPEAEPTPVKTKKTKTEKEKNKDNVKHNTPFHDRVLIAFLEKYPDLCIIHADEDVKPTGYAEWVRGRWIHLTETHIKDRISDVAKSICIIEKLQAAVEQVFKEANKELRKLDTKTNINEWDNCLESVPLGDSTKAYSLTEFAIIDNPRNDLNAIGFPCPAHELRSGFDEIESGDCKWLTMLRDWHPKDPEKIHFLQVACGNALLGNKKAIALLITGNGGEGKSLFFDCIEAAVGEILYDVTPEEVYLKLTNSPVDGKSKLGLRRARFSVVSEIGDMNSRWQEGAFKAITAGDKIKVRPLYSNYITFRPRTMPIICGNHLPIAKDIGIGMSRRLKVVEFLTRQDLRKDALEDSEKRETLLQIRGSILAWMLIGAKYMIDNNAFPPCGSIDDASKDYFTGEDEFRFYFEKFAERAEGEWMPRKQFIDRFEELEQRVAMRMKVDRKLGAILKDRPDLNKAYTQRGGFYGFENWKLKNLDADDGYGGGNDNDRTDF